MLVKSPPPVENPELASYLLDLYIKVNATPREYTPTSAADIGDPGDTAYDSNYFYICIDYNTWRRIAHNTW